MWVVEGLEETAVDAYFLFRFGFFEDENLHILEGMLSEKAVDQHIVAAASVVVLPVAFANRSLLGMAVVLYLWSLDTSG